MRITTMVLGWVLAVSAGESNGRRSLRCLLGRHTDVEVRLNPEDRSIVSRQCVRCHRVRDGGRFSQFPHDQRKGDTAWMINGGQGSGGIGGM